jgi:hypothetical protein
MIQGPQKSVPDHFRTILNFCTLYQLISALVQILRLDLGWFSSNFSWKLEQNLTKMGFRAQFPASEYEIIFADSIWFWSHFLGAP